jgi:hypothetical protein
VALFYNPSYSGGREQKECDSKPAWANSLWDSLKNTEHKNRTGGVAHVVQCLPSKHEA